MEKVEKTVFLSYRRTNFPWALSIFKNLTQHGYDVFFDFNGIDSGDFERVILANIRARAHFLVLLTPSALERCGEPEDWVRREIETALENQRNVVPLMLEGFSFGTPKVDIQLTGKLAALMRYNAVRIPSDYFDEAMERLRARHLNGQVSAVLHALSVSAQQATNEQMEAANAAPAVKEGELTAQQWVERAIAANDGEEQIRFSSEAIRLKPDYVQALIDRGDARDLKGDHDGAFADFNEVCRLKPDYAVAFYKRAGARCKRDPEGAIADWSEAIRFKPDYGEAFYFRGLFLLRVDRKAGKEDLAQAKRLGVNHSF